MRRLKETMPLLHVITLLILMVFGQVDAYAGKPGLELASVSAGTIEDLHGGVVSGDDATPLLSSARRLEASSKLIAIWPILGNSRLSSEFGKRRHPIKKSIVMHKGVDLSAPRGTKILAVAAGTVTFAGWRNGYGRTVEITHSNGWTTIYAHAQKLTVKTGDQVLQGQTIATVGSTGGVTGPHLHLEVRKNNRLVDPMSLYPDGYAVVMQSL